jgi:hypothetical protein
MIPMYSTDELSHRRKLEALLFSEPGSPYDLSVPAIDR